ncbi:MAG: tRNA threonylcarbamoyladenosine dehydratase [Clostridiales Family XIII bacterium]|nr:tRNA threonylcarbamoyladenosine dehydratase [Clostridiales Family XIII bacterium]
MTVDQFSRTAMQIGQEGLQKLFASRVAVFGIGGVGGYSAEALARAGVGAIDIFDDDLVCATNINRQVIALTSTIGKYKVDVMSDRIADINPDCIVTAHRMFYMPDTSPEIDMSEFDYVIDAIDTVTGKIELIMRCREAGVPIVSVMGAANKMDPTQFVVTDIFSTEMDPLAKVMRKELKSRGVGELKVVYSKERPTEPIEDMEISCRYGCICPADARRNCLVRRQIPASNPFVPPVAGLIAAGEVVKYLARATRA